MTGIPEYNYPEFNATEEILVSFGHSVLNPTGVEALNPTPGIPQPWDWYMRHAIRMVISSDAIALLAGWEYSRGARLERRIGLELGLDVRESYEWMTS
jgi:hypothetical protein